MLNSLQNPYILKIEEFFVADKDCVTISPELIIVSELAEENLDQFVMKHESDLDEETILRIFTQIVIGIHSMHNNKVDHRDLKPLNILLFENGKIAKIADFGLARHIQNIDTQLTADVGTFKYMAPEAKLSKPTPFKSDIYSLGLILHFMLTKTLPLYDGHVTTGRFKITKQFSKNIISLLG